MKEKWQSTVEPISGTLTQFMRLRKITTMGISQANKVMHLSAMAYNLKKYLKFTQKLAKSGARAFAYLFNKIMGFQNLINLNYPEYYKTTLRKNQKTLKKGLNVFNFYEFMVLCNN